MAERISLYEEGARKIKIDGKLTEFMVIKRRKTSGRAKKITVSFKTLSGKTISVKATHKKKATKDQK